MSNLSPFLQFKVECPVCKTINEFDQIRVGAYTENGRDTDFCSKDIKWRNPKYQAYNPLAFFTSTCGNCFYTRELTNKFKDWKNDVAYRTYQLKIIKIKHLEQLSTSDSIIKLLGQAVETQRYPNESAILKLHLAIFDVLLADHPSNLDVGRFYIRIGWLYREMGQGENPNQLLLGGLVRDIETRYDAASEALHGVDTAFCELKDCVASHFQVDQIPAEIQSKMFSFRDRYEADIKDLETSYRVAEEKLKQFGTLVEEYRTAILGADVDDSQVAFGESKSFTDFLQQAKQSWNGVAVNEHEAMEHAIHYYKEAFASGRDIGTGVAQIQASYLIAELSRRIGDYDGAKQFFTSTIKAGQEFIYKNRRDPSRTALARKILELAIEQGRLNLVATQ